MPFRPVTGKSWLAQYGRLVGAWAKRSTTPQDAEDAVQDAALAILESDSLTVRDHGKYFHRAAANRAVSIHRAERLRETQSLDDVPEDMHPCEPSAEAVYKAGELARLMLEALAELPESCQTAFRLRQAEGLSNGEIARRMGVSLNMVERHMMRTTRHLQDKLQENVG